MVRMVNSSSFDSLGPRNVKREQQFTQPVKRGEHRQTTGSPVEAEGACSRDEDDVFLMHTNTINITSQQAIEPIASRTEIQSNISDDNDKNRGFYGPGELKKEKRENNVPSVCCSVPLDRIRNILQKINSPTSTDLNTNDEKKLQKRLLCLYCNRTFVTSTLRQKHVDRFHLLRSRRRSSVRQQQRIFDSVCLYCEEFNEATFTLKKLFVHLVTTHHAKYYGCLQCEVRFPSRIALQEHSIQNHNTGIVNTYSNSSDLGKIVTLPNENPATVTTTEPTIVEITNEDGVDENGVDQQEVDDKKKQVVVKSNQKNKKRAIISTKAASKFINRRLTRQQAKIMNVSRKAKEPVPRNTKEVVMSKVKTKSSYSTQVRQYPNIDLVFKYKKITDHSIDNLRIGSLTFEDVVFDKAFFNKVKCNIQENLLNYIDGKLLFKNVTLDNRISSFEVPIHTDSDNTVSSEQLLLDVYLNNVTPVTTILSSTLKDENDLLSEKSKKKTNLKNDEVHYKYFTRRKYQAILSESREHRDLSKLDMWTQLAIKDRQSKIVNDQRTTKEKIEYAKSEEYRTKLQVEELDRILDQRAPYENLKEEALRTSVMQKLDGSHDEDYLERYLDVQAVLMDILDKVYEKIDCFKEPEVSIKSIDVIPLTKQKSSSNKGQEDNSNEIPLYFNLERKKNSHPSTLSLPAETSSASIEDLKVSPHDQRLVELTGEWTRTKIYVCAACGLKIPSLKQLIDHRNVFHSSVWCQNYEFVGSQSELYYHLSIPGLGKVGRIEGSSDSKIWRRSEARVCSKCDKRTNCLGELHRHILECGGDLSWANERKKQKYRYGSKSRRRRKGLLKLIRFERKERKPSDKRKLRRRFSGPRSKPSDAESIERMLANLPPKRTVRKIISFKDGFSRKRNKKVSNETAILPKTKSNLGGKTRVLNNVTTNPNEIGKGNSNSDVSNPQALLVADKTCRVLRKSQKYTENTTTNTAKCNKSVLGEQKTDKEIVVENKLVNGKKLAIGSNKISKGKNNKIISLNQPKGKLIPNKSPARVVSSKIVKTKPVQKKNNNSNDKYINSNLSKNEMKVKSLNEEKSNLTFKKCTKKTKPNKKIKAVTNTGSKVVNFGQKSRKSKLVPPPAKESETVSENPDMLKKEPSMRNIMNKIFPNLKRKNKSMNNGLVSKRFKKSAKEVAPKRNITEPLVKLEKNIMRKTNRKVRKPGYDSNFIIGTSNQKSEPKPPPSSFIPASVPEEKVKSVMDERLLSQSFFHPKEEPTNCVSVNIEREIKDELEMGPTEGDTAPTSTIDEIKDKNSGSDPASAQEFDSISNNLSETKEEDSCDFKAKLSVAENICAVKLPETQFGNSKIVTKKRDKGRSRDINNCIALLKSKLHCDDSIDGVSIFASFNNTPSKRESNNANAESGQLSEVTIPIEKNKNVDSLITNSEENLEKIDVITPEIKEETNVEAVMPDQQKIVEIKSDLIIPQPTKPKSNKAKRNVQKKCKITQSNQLDCSIGNDSVPKEEALGGGTQERHRRSPRIKNIQTDVTTNFAENKSPEKLIIQSSSEVLIKNPSQEINKEVLFENSVQLNSISLLKNCETTKNIKDPLLNENTIDSTDPCSSLHGNITLNDVEKLETSSKNDVNDVQAKDEESKLILNNKSDSIVSLEPVQLDKIIKRVKGRSKPRFQSKNNIQIQKVIECKKMVENSLLDADKTDLSIVSIVENDEVKIDFNSVSNPENNQKINLRGKKARKRNVKKVPKRCTPSPKGDVEQLGFGQEEKADIFEDKNSLNPTSNSASKNEEIEEIKDEIENKIVSCEGINSSSEDDEFNVPIIDLIKNKINDDDDSCQNKSDVAEPATNSNDLLDKKCTSDSEDDLPLALFVKKIIENPQKGKENVAIGNCVETELSKDVEDEISNIKTDNVVDSVVENTCNDFIKKEVVDIKTETSETVESKEVEADKENELLFERAKQQKTKSNRTKKRKRSEKTKIKISIINEETIDVISKHENHKNCDVIGKDDHLGKLEDSSKISISITSTNTLKPVQVQSEIEEGKEEYSDGTANINEEEYFKRSKSRNRFPTILDDNLIKPHANGIFEMDNNPDLKNKEKRKHHRNTRKIKKSNKERTKTHLTISFEEAPYLNKIKICKKETRTEENTEYPRVTNNLHLDFCNFDTADSYSKNEYIVSPVNSKRNSLNSELDLTDSVISNSINDSHEKFERILPQEENTSQKAIETPSIEILTDPEGKEDNRVAASSSSSSVRQKNAKKFSCELCQKTFRRLDSLTKHKRTLTHIAKLSAMEAENVMKNEEIHEDDTKLDEYIPEITDSKENLICNATSNSSKTKINCEKRDLYQNLSDIGQKCLLSEDIKQEEIVFPEKKIDTTTLNMNPSTLPSIKCSIFLSSNGSNFIREKLDKSKLKNLNPVVPEVHPSVSYNISEDNLVINKKLDDQTSRKVLNHDEELFLECCSLLKGGSEISGTPKLEIDPNSFLKRINFQSTPVVDDIKTEIVENKTTNLVNSYLTSSSVTYSTNSDFSNFSSLQKSEEKLSSIEDPNGTSDMEVDVSLDSFPNRNTTISQIYENKTIHDYKNQYQNNVPYEKIDMFDTTDGFSNLSFGDAISNTKNENFYESSEKEDDDFDNNSSDMEENINCDLRNKVISRFGNLMAKALRNRYKNVTNIITPTNMKRKRQYLDSANSLSTEKQTCYLNGDCKANAKRILTKGALKTFEKLDENLLENSNQYNSKFLKDCPEKETMPHNNSAQFVPSRSNGAMKRKLSNILHSNDNSFNIGCWGSASYDVYEFEETQDNSMFTKNLSSFRNFKTIKSNTPVKNDDQKEDSNSPKVESDLSQTSPSNSKLKSNKIITKKKCKIMGKIFKNSCKSNTGSIKCISITDDSDDVIEDFSDPLPADQQKESEDSSQKNHKMSQEEMDILFNKLVGIKDISSEDFKESRLDNFEENEDIPKQKKVKKIQQKIKRKRRRKRNSENSTDEEFNINRPYKRKGKNEINEGGINLEQELKECIGVASRKSQRKCTSGKQNVLVEYWSSDDSMTEALFKKSLEDSKVNGDQANKVEIKEVQPPTDEKRIDKELKVHHDGELEERKPEELTKSLDVEVDKTKDDNNRIDGENNLITSTNDEFDKTDSEQVDSIIEPILQNSNEISEDVPVEKLENSNDSLDNNMWQTSINKNNNLSLNLEVSIVDRKQKRSQKNNSQGNERKYLNKFKRRKVSKKIHENSENVKKRVKLPEDSETIAKRRKKRSKVVTLYYWSTSSDDEQDIIKVQNFREELDYSNEDRPLQHGWIVGDSPKKLVTMLAQAKGKKIDSNCVKEQNKR